MVWDDNGNRPGNVLYEQPHELPSHADPYTDFVTYRLDEPVAIDGTFYVGFHQSHSVQLNLGFDQNTDARANFLYMTTNVWCEPFLKGTPMVRPVVGAPLPEPVNIVQQETADVQLYPNPVSSTLTIVLPEQRTMKECCIFDSFGRVVESRCGDAKNLNVSNLAPGLYLLRLTDMEGHVYTRKFVKE